MNKNYKYNKTIKGQKYYLAEGVLYKVIIFKVKFNLFIL